MQASTGHLFRTSRRLYRARPVRLVLSSRARDMNFCLDNCAPLYVADPLNEPFYVLPRFVRARCCVGAPSEFKGKKRAPLAALCEGTPRNGTKIRRDISGVGLRTASAARTRLRNFVAGACGARSPDIKNCYEGENGRKKFAEANEIHIRIRPQASISGLRQTLARYISETFILVYPARGEKKQPNPEGGKGRKGKPRNTLSSSLPLARAVDRSCS